ncbi:MAG: multiheme c-type cytochrome [Desulfomonilaceae bacterium]
MERFSTAAHGALRCEVCHTEFLSKDYVHPNVKDPAALKKDPVRTYDYKRCSSCHVSSYNRYITGEHAKALAKQQLQTKESENTVPPERSAPTCGDCHASHYVQAKQSRIALGQQMIGVCGKCHASQVATYLNNIHGRLGVFLDKKASAYCTDCHGAHACESLKDREKALIACKRCHLNATVNFAAIVIHAGLDDASKKDSEKQGQIRLMLITKRIGQVLIGIVIVFFAVQTFVWILRELHNKLRGR